MSRRPDRPVVLGRITGVFGVRGWTRARSYTDPPSALAGYKDVLLRLGEHWRAQEVEAGRTSASGVQLKLRGVDDRESAQKLVGSDLAVRRSALPALEPGRYYLDDIEGLEALSPEGTSLGTVDHFLDTPAHPVIVLRGVRELLVPLVPERILGVDFERGTITLDWQPDW